MKKQEFKKIIKEIGFASQKEFAEAVGVKATTFTTYKNIPSHIVRIINISLMARRDGISFEQIRLSMKVD